MFLKVCVYKIVFTKANNGEICLKRKESVQSWLIAALNDPIAKMLIKNSQLTKIQLETLLIDVFTDNLYTKKLKYDDKAKFRLTKAKISRGAFNRTLKQSKENVIKSIFTVLLLGYLGIFESTSLDTYLEVANKLQRYIDAYKNLSNEKEHVIMMKMLREELAKNLNELSKP